ncbi:MAG TPA: hypothetical protein DIW24_06985 [Bacteroidetes bacterium]|nr:hypothetical protein [Bacteroidota bacterium]
MTLTGLGTPLLDIPTVAQPWIGFSDPLRQPESASRDFSNRFSGRTFLVYQPGYVLPASSIPPTPPTPSHKPVPKAYQFALRADVGLSSHLDLQGIWGQTAMRNGRIGLAWLGVKYYLQSDHKHFAFRLAIQPPFSESSISGVDIGGYTETKYRNMFSTEFAMGFRYQRMGLSDEPLVNPETGHRMQHALLRRSGKSIHASRTYRFAFDPAASNLFISLKASAGNMDILPIEVRNYESPSPKPIKEQGGLMSLEIGLSLLRPAWQFSPYFRIPIRQTGAAHDAIRLGANLQLR